MTKTEINYKYKKLKANKNDKITKQNNQKQTIKKENESYFLDKS